MSKRRRNVARFSGRVWNAVAKTWLCHQISQQPPTVRLRDGFSQQQFDAEERGMRNRAKTPTCAQGQVVEREQRTAHSKSR